MRFEKKTLCTRSYAQLLGALHCDFRWELSARWSY